MQSHLAAFFRVELTAADIPALHGGSEQRAVFGVCDHVGLAVSGVEGMDKIDAVALFDILEEGTFVFGKAQGVPADVRDG